ncbi:MAG: thioredoxin family protein [Candidatus Hodarchaeota archaeon]
MVSVKSQMLKLGTKAPEFSLKNSINDQIMSLEENKGNNGTLVFFICNHCPFVIHVRDQFKPLYEEYSAKGISFLAINSNSTETHPQDGPKHMKTLANDMQWDFPYLFDDTQEVAMAYNAACTPDFFLFDKELKLYYRGQLDSSRPKTNISVTGEDLRNALDSLLEGKPSPVDQKPSMGCNIKWKPGNEPQYFTDAII